MVDRNGRVAEPVRGGSAASATSHATALNVGHPNRNVGSRSRTRAPSGPAKARCSLAVFAPSPILTITVERGAGGDPDIHLHAGGQGFWIARMAASLGAEVSLCCALGGETGRVLRALMTAEGVSVRAVDSRASNGAYIHDRRSGQRFDVATSPAGELGRHDADELYGLTLANGLDADLTLLSGVRPESTLDADIYRRLADDLRANSRTVIADLTGAPLASALAGGISLVKLSHEELVAEGRAASEEISDLVEGMRALKRAGAKTVLLSRGSKPALVLDGKRDAWRILELVGPRFEPADPAGSGDSMFAALGVGLGSGSELVDSLRLAVAAGALNATRRGLGTGTRDQVERLSRHVHLQAMVDAPLARRD